jgi:hypothetical protein
MRNMTVIDAVNRGINFFAISVFGITGIGSFHEFVEEDDTGDKMDDSFYVTEALVAVIWYKYSGKSIKRTLIPFYFMFAGFLTKGIGLYNEQHTSTPSKSELAYFFVLGMTIIVFLYQFYKYRNITKT